MNLIVLSVNILICLGAAIMALNLKKFKGVMKMMKQISTDQYDSLKSILLLHYLLIASFLVGYLVVLYAVNKAGVNIGTFFATLIFFLGAVFVLLGIRLQKRMIVSLKKTYQDAFEVNTKLTANQDELTRTNQSLKKEIEEHRKTEVTLQRSHDTQIIVNRLLKESLIDSSSKDIADLCLDLVLSLPWLSSESKGCIYLVDEDPDLLFMKAHRGFSDELLKRCASVKFEECLCGLAASGHQTVFAKDIDNRHTIRIPEMVEHGHYCIPIQAKETVLGVINIYIKPGHKRCRWEESFLKTIANTLALILVQHQSEHEKKKMELRLHQPQKMESIGTLASGIAHDFNNILSGIFGYVQLARMNRGNSRKIGYNLDQINEGAKRASDLIQQILTFSRQNKYKKSPVRLYLIVKEAIKFLRSSIPTTITIREKIQSKAYVTADPTQIHQIVMNLCTNASHAMHESGGILVVKLTRISIQSKHDITGKTVIPGEYLRLDISDTGCGIPHDIQTRIFEPYFTTKKKGEGTGLGLAVVLGIVEDHNGYITVNSDPGLGTTFSIYLPELKQITRQPDRPVKKALPERGSERILIVDDEESILSSTSELLEDFGYSITRRSDPAAAFSVFKENPDHFDLVITDMTMPNMTGDMLASEILKLRKTIPIILCTGFSDRISKNRALKIGIRKYLQKPIDSTYLLHTIRKLLDNPLV